MAACLRHAQYQVSQHSSAGWKRTPESSPLTGEPLKVSGFCERDTQFSLTVWLLVGNYIPVDGLTFRRTQIVQKILYEILKEPIKIVLRTKRNYKEKKEKKTSLLKWRILRNLFTMKQ